jgi:hypothetical protein
MEMIEKKPATTSHVSRTGQPALRLAKAKPKTPEPMVDPTTIIVASINVRRCTLRAASFFAAPADIVSNSFTYSMKKKPLFV